MAPIESFAALTSMHLQKIPIVDADQVQSAENVCVCVRVSRNRRTSGARLCRLSLHVDSRG